MDYTQKKTYTQPRVEVLSCRVEKGFTQSATPEEPTDLNANGTQSYEEGGERNTYFS